MSTFLQVTDNASVKAIANSLNNTTTPITLSGINTTRFDPVTTSYIVTIYDDVAYSDPFDDPQMEKATVTAATIAASGSLTLNRTSPKTHAGTPRISLFVIAKHLTDITTAINTNEAAIALKAQSLNPTAVKTTAYTAAANDFVPVDTTSAPVTITLPTAPANGTRVGVKLVIQGGTNTITITRGGSSDVFNKTGGNTSVTLTLSNQAVQFQYFNGIWYGVGADIGLTALDARYQATLTSGTNIKTINGTSLLGSGDLAISGGGTYDPSTDVLHVLRAGDTMTGQLLLANSNTSIVPIKVNAINGQSVNLIEVGINGGVAFSVSSGNVTNARDIRPTANNTYNIGTTGLYYSNSYITRQNFNSTAYLDGGTAGVINIQGATLGTSSVTSGAANKYIVTQSASNTSDLSDSALQLDYNLSAASATNELVSRVFRLSATNTLTGGGAITNMRIINIITNTAASTTTTNMDGIYMEATTTAGTVTNNRGLYINTMQGTSNAGVVVNTLTGTNKSLIILGQVTIPTGSYSIYNASVDTNYFNGSIGHLTSAPTHTYTQASTGTGIALYNTTDQTTNYERVLMQWSGNVFGIKGGLGGTGTARNITLGTANRTTMLTLVDSAAAAGFVQFNNGTGTPGAYGVVFGGTWNASSSTNATVSISPTISQTSTAGYTALLINPNETATGNGAKLLIDAQVGSSSKFKVDNTGKVTTTGGIVSRTGTTASNATPAINTDTVDFYSLTAQAVDITSMTSGLTGTPVEGQKLWLAITGTAARAINWGASFENGAATLPLTTVTTQRLDVGLIYNSVTSKFRCMASGSA